jgi:hypothetical protein
MANLNFLPKSFRFIIFIFFLVCFATLLLAVSKNAVNSNQCFSATYSIVSDYTNEDLPLLYKKQLSDAAKQNKKIYTITQSSTHSYEQLDSIAHICGGESIMYKPEVIVRTKGQESIDYFYITETEQRCFSVQEPAYLDDWKITGPMPYKNTEDRYFKAFKQDSDDYVIFDSNTPVPLNLKLIRGIPGLIVEASIGVAHMRLLDFKSASCANLNGKIKQVEKASREKVKRADLIDLGDFLNPLTGQGFMSSDDFECVESF